MFFTIILSHSENASRFSQNGYGSKETSSGCIGRQAAGCGADIADCHGLNGQLPDAIGTSGKAGTTHASASHVDSGVGMRMHYFRHNRYI